MAQKITVRTLLEAGVHFGHQTRRWNPKMKPYIFTSRNDIYILDLKQTMYALDSAYSFVLELAQRGGTILFVGTKKQAQETIERNAKRCGMPYVNQRWLGGMLTNFVTMRSRITRMDQLEAMDANGVTATLPKKEQIQLSKELGKLQTNLGGVRDMLAVPQAIFVVDTVREEIAIREARRLRIPVIGMLDTNSDPDMVDFGIPANDDAIRSIDLITTILADAVIAGAGSTADIADVPMVDAAQVEQMAAEQEGAAPAAQQAPAPTAAELIAQLAEPAGEQEAAAPAAETAVQEAPADVPAPAEAAAEATAEATAEAAAETAVQE